MSQFLNQFWLLEPRGPIARISFISIIVDFLTMMLIIGPTVLLLLWCIWRYRRAGGKGRYQPGWTHSLTIEIFSWGFPLAIVAFLSFYSYEETYAVNPFAPGIMKHGRTQDADRPPINVQVITTDWQWLFIYPDQHVASANELVVPVHTPVRFTMTSATVSNDFYIPQLAGEIDIMPGMITHQALIANRIGQYEGIEAEFNGPGFSWMQFKTRVVSDDAFRRWVGLAAQSPVALDQASFDRFATPFIDKDGSVLHFSNANGAIFQHVLEQTMAGKTYETPENMTEKKTSGDQGRREPQSASPKSQL